jgi:three-Cys-motif partner protein
VNRSKAQNVARKRTDISTIGYWSEVKLDIVRDYASAYSTILAAQTRPRLEHVYIDAFSGSGVHMAKGTSDLVWGSPTSVLLVDPPFREYHFIDLDRGNIETLRTMVEGRTTGPYDPRSVHFYEADCNEVLLAEVFPRVRYENYKRALCLLDPYGLHLDWRVIHAAGQMRSVEIFLNFPIHDMNRNVLRRAPRKVSPKQIARMTRYWGDKSWRKVSYTTEGNLFGFEEKTTNEAVVEAFRERLRTVAGFHYVPDPMPMRNSKGAVVYFLFFAAQRPVAAKIVKQIFDKHRDRKA